MGKIVKPALAFLVVPAAFGQAPSIERVLNAASQAPASYVAFQMWVAIQGQNLAQTVASSSDVPLPTQLAGTTVTFNGVAAPLNYVSPTQINAQVPGVLMPVDIVDIVVTTSAGSSAKTSILTALSTPGIFTQDYSGCGQGLVYNIHNNGTIGLNTPASSLDPSSDVGVALFMTGLGYFADRADGVPWQYNPADNQGVSFLPANQRDVVLGMPGVFDYTTYFDPAYLGPAPLTVGVDQMNALMSGALPEGCRIPMALTAGNTQPSQFVNVSIHTGGGACADPPSSSLMIVTYQDTTVSDVTGTSTSGNVSVQILEAPHVMFPPPPPAFASAFNIGILQNPTFCAASYPTTLNTGSMTVTGPGDATATLQPQNNAGVITYQAPLPNLPITAGNYTLTGTGGGIAGPFAATLQIPAPIVITTELDPGTMASVEDVTINWTGGDSSSVVSFQLIEGGLTYAIITVPATQGTFSYHPGPPDSPAIDIPIFPESPNVEIIVTQQPGAALPFAVPGLTMGGQQNWKYVFDFRGLVNPF